MCHPAPNRQASYGDTAYTFTPRPTLGNMRAGFIRVRRKVDETMKEFIVSGYRGVSGWFYPNMEGANYKHLISA